MQLQHLNAVLRRNEAHMTLTWQLKVVGIKIQKLYVTLTLKIKSCPTNESFKSISKIYFMLLSQFEAQHFFLKSILHLLSWNVFWYVFSF